MSSNTRAMDNKKHKPLALMLCFAAVGVHRAAMAEDATLPTVTVNAASAGAQAPTAGYTARSSAAASKTDTPLNELDQSVSVVTRQQIETQNPGTLSEALRYTPGVYGNLIGANTRYDYVVLRGFGSGSPASNEWLDGLRLLGDASGNNKPQIDPFFIERIDVVRGPASVLYGQSSPGGLVALTAKRPLSEPLHQLELSEGNRQQRALGLDMTGPLAGRPDLDYRLVIKAQSANQQQSLSQSERYAVAPSLMWRIDSRNRLLLQAYLQKEPEIGYNGSVPYQGSAVDHNGWRLPASFDDASPTDGSRREQQFYGYRFEHDFNTDWQFRQNLRYQRSKVRSQQVYQTGWAADNSNLLNRAASMNEEHGEGYVIDNQLQGHFATGALAHTLLVGVDAYRLWNDGYDRTGTVSAIDASAPSYANENIAFGAPVPFSRRNMQTGLYLQDQLAWQQWRLNLGLRHDRAELASANPQTGSNANRRDDKTTRRAGLLYLADNGLSPYFNYSEGFDPNGSGYVDANGNILPAQQSRQKELGIKYQPANSPLQLSAAVYDLLQQNMAYFNPVLNYSQPVGSVRSRGIELEAKTRVGKRLSLMASFSANRMRIEQGAQQGNAPFGTPARMASLWADYAFDNGWTLGGGARYLGPVWLDDGNTLQLPSSTLVDLSLHYDLGRLNSSLRGASARLAAGNLLNRTYVASCYNNATYCYFGAKRNLTATLGYQW
ncbi:TonB-dependent siderophore receptor [Paludibacterium purpuratum]|uniref:Iron complex outermembrane receptor protein n=1 Tax=Paludibacterium purpuratum TaxID=1144873 RepID=A0A4R7BD10_9NEIS|nr:TonB-dependent siderophore receptor [Paludibacterium purpuratum]TDR82848.1 iron complex outermembrane receptor protein [Paludibacterium purpuratum]